MRAGADERPHLGGREHHEADCDLERLRADGRHRCRDGLPVPHLRLRDRSDCDLDGLRADGRHWCRDGLLVVVALAQIDGVNGLRGLCLGRLVDHAVAAAAARRALRGRGHDGLVDHAVGAAGAQEACADGWCGLTERRGPGSVAGWHAPRPSAFEASAAAARRRTSGVARQRRHCFTPALRLRLRWRKGRHEDHRSAPRLVTPIKTP